MASYLRGVGSYDAFSVLTRWLEAARLATRLWLGCELDTVLRAALGAFLCAGLSNCNPSPPAPPRMVEVEPLPATLLAALRLNSNIEGHAQVVTRLHALRAQWRTDPRYSLPVAMRLGWEYDRLHQPDSAYHYRLLAERQAAGLARAQPLLAATAASDLGNFYWQRQEFDSSRIYYQRAAQRLTGYDTLSTTAHQAAPGNVIVLGPTLASHCANTGLSYERRGDLATAIRYYARAARLYQLHTNSSGLNWTHSLVAGAYAAQGANQEAAAAYELALNAARRYGRPASGVIDASARLFAETLYEYQPILLRQGATQHLAALLAEGEALADAVAPHLTQPDERMGLLINRASLALGTAEVQLTLGQSAEAPLARADSLLRHVQRIGGTGLLQHRQFYAYRVQWLLLEAWRVHARGASPEPRIRQAVARLDSIGLPGERRTTQLRLAAKCLDLGQPAQAIALLQPLMADYRQTRNRLHLRDAYEYLARAYAATSRLDSAYRHEYRLRLLTDTLRAARQYGALTEVETRYRTREKEARIRQLTDLAVRERRLTSWAIGSALLLTLLLAAVGVALRVTRRFNQRLRGLNQELAAQRNQIREQAEALTVLDRAKSQFFANVSHELRTPLTLVLGPLEQVLAGADALPDTIRAPLALAARQGQRLRELVNRILDFSKLQAGKLVVEAAPTPLAALVRRLSGQFASLAEQQGVHLTQSGEFPTELVVSVDADKVEQIITNLLSNALHYTPLGGQVVVVSEKAGADRYALTVRDTGPGIAAAEQASIFERYYQSPQRQAQGGTGLGLALARELAELLGGSLTLNSIPGQGAAFTLEFPAERLPDALLEHGIGLEALAALAAPVTTPALQPETIHSELETQNPKLAPLRARVLIVEDHADLRAYLRQLLEPTYDVVEAADGQVALEVLAHTTVDLITTDAMMPRLSGTELLEHLKADTHWRGIPVLMLTARADDGHRLAALEVGVDDYLTKPFRAAELLTRIRALLGRYRVRQQYATLLPTELLPPANDPHTPAESAEEIPQEELLEQPGAEGFPPEESSDGAIFSGVPPGVSLPAPPSVEQLRVWRTTVAPHLSDETFGPEALAALLLLSRRTLYRHLHELTGLTPGAWLRELRLDHARRLLEARTYPTIAEVAYASGFASASYFGKAFAERFGCRPSEYGR